jgi:small subunit ribosomal protein S2e
MFFLQIFAPPLPHSLSATPTGVILPPRTTASTMAERGGRRGGRRGGHQPEEEKWVPVTKLGRLVKDKRISSIEELYLHSLPVKEYQMVD